jgi:hypothetical protein
LSTLTQVERSLGSFGQYLRSDTGGLQRRRVLWVREMSEEEIRHVGDSGPTIDSIQVAEFESQAVLKEWLTEHAPAFAR